MQGALEPGTKVAGRYVIDALLGKGGMGAVYVARHEELGRQVALKVLLPEVAKDADVVARFFREARTAAAIRHPAIVEVFDVGRDGELSFIVMEKLEGEELADRIRLSGPLGPRFVTLLGVEIAEAISAAHARGVIHRDLKPRNVFLAQRGNDQEVVKVLDFGIAKLADGDVDGAQLTKTGEIFGTPLYMPPEQLQARKDIDARADVYSIGVILYEALTARPPYHADSYPALVLRIVEGKPESLDSLRPGLPPLLCAIVDKAMAADREQRYPSAAALASALFTLAQTLPPDPTPEAGAVTAENVLPPGAVDAVDELGSTLQRAVVTPGHARYLLSLSKPVTPLPDAPPAPRATGPTAVPAPPVTPRPARGARWVWASVVALLAAGGWWFASSVTAQKPLETASPPAVVPQAAPRPTLPVPVEPAATPPAAVPEPTAVMPVKPAPKSNPRPGPPKKPSAEEPPPPLLPR